MNLADRVVTSKHVEVEGLGVFSDACPYANIWSGPSYRINTFLSDSKWEIHVVSFMSIDF